MQKLADEILQRGNSGSAIFCDILNKPCSCRQQYYNVYWNTELRSVVIRDRGPVNGQETNKGLDEKFCSRLKYIIEYVRIKADDYLAYVEECACLSQAQSPPELTFEQLKGQLIEPFEHKSLNESLYQ